jgi:hypothetical protein
MSVLNRWGITAVLAMVAVLPAGFAVAALSGVNTPSSDFAALTVMHVAISCSIIASKLGSRWWLIVSVLATLWTCVVLVQMMLGE